MGTRAGGNQPLGWRARAPARGGVARRRRHARRCGAGRRGADFARAGGGADGHFRLQRRAGGGESCAAAQAGVPGGGAAHRQDRVGKRQPLHLPPAAFDLHAGRDAGPRSRQAEEKALGDRGSELRIRAVRRRFVQEAADPGAARRRVRRRAGAAARQDRRRRARAGAAGGQAGGGLQRLVCGGFAEVRARRQYARPVQEHRGGQPARRRARVSRSAERRDPRRLVGHRLSVERDQHARAHEVPRRLSEALEGLPAPRLGGRLLRPVRGRERHPEGRLARCRQADRRPRRAADGNPLRRDPVAAERPPVDHGRLRRPAREERRPGRDGQLALRGGREGPTLRSGGPRVAQGVSGSAVLLQILNGLAGASSLFLVAAGLSLIFGVSRIVNFAHGSLYMLGMYLAVSLSGSLGFWASVPLAAALVAAAGFMIETTLLRRIYKAPQLLQLLATFALVLIIKDAALWAWGPQDMLGPRAPGLAGAVTIAGRQFPQYDLLLIVLGPAVFIARHLLLSRTRWGTLVRAATQDREMAAALGVNERRLFTTVFALGALLAGFGGASAIPREPASLEIDLAVISDAFVVVVVGGLGSIPGAFLAALLIGEVKAFCIALGYSKITLAVEFIVMAVVLVLRPWGLLGRPSAPARGPAGVEPPLGALSPRGALALAALVGVARSRAAGGGLPWCVSRGGLCVLVLSFLLDGLVVHLQCLDQ